MAKFNGVVEFVLNYALMNLDSTEVSCRKSMITMKQLPAYGTRKTKVSRWLLSQQATCTNAHI
jgi:hypothetical protein